MSFATATIRRKLMTVIVTTSLTALGLAFAVLAFWEYSTRRTTVARGLVTRGAIMAATCSAALAFENRDDAREILLALRNDPNIDGACLYDRGGRVFATYPPGMTAAAFPTPAVATSGRFDAGHFKVFQPVTQAGRRLGTLYFQFDLSDLDGRIRLDIGLLVVVMIASTALASLLSKSLQKKISGPILDLVDTARSVTERRDYSIRARRSSEDELADLADAFNRMLAEIERRDRSLEQVNAGLEQRVAVRTSQLEAANRELEAFAYSVSHDLRAPLRSIDGFSQALLEDEGDRLDERGRSQLSRVREAAQRMAQLIDDLLQLSRVTRSEMKSATVDLSALAREIAAELAEGEPGRAVELDIDGGLVAHGDERLLRAALSNLLGNSWKFTRGRRPAVIEFGRAAESGAFFVRDNGAGFDMAYAGKLFGAFQRLHHEDEFEGTGIGLATVQRVIHRHGGRIWAESEPGIRTTFYFTLPD